MSYDDKSKRILDLYKQQAVERQRRELILSPDQGISQSKWEELVEQAVDNGLDTMKIQDLVRMADYAKILLKEKGF